MGASQQEWGSIARPFVGRGVVVFCLIWSVGCGHPPKPDSVSNPSDPVLLIAKDLTKDGHAWRLLATLCDTWGHRLSGSASLEGAIDWAVQTLKAGGITNARREEVIVPHWVRGQESATLLSPKIAGQSVSMAMLGLGNSVGTPPAGVTSEVLVVHNDAEFHALGDRVHGKIVLFNNPMPAWTEHDGACYGKTVVYRVKGAIMAAKRGAVAVLIRSVTARSLRSPHTGMLRYDNKTRKIPAAALSTEDADRIDRLTQAGHKVRVRLTMGASFKTPSKSANVVAEIIGRERPEEVVIVSGHIDSWDVGQGAHDDGVGVIMAMETLMTLKRLGLQPRRTIRAVLWTNEENGMAGVRSYLKRHKAELPNHVAAIEADAGGFLPVRWGVSVRDPERQRRAAETVAAFLPRARAVAPAVASMTVKPGSSAPDVGWFRRHGVPALGLFTHGERYFDYHHTKADTVDKVDPQELSLSAAAMATLAWHLAERPARLGD
ncbi:MAG: M20/M25/M40 family metallo-hydrolase [Myxococcales bacterium]|nr:M20/M25/M40 family metallo-hydrolase [Myxococcales bacterium]